MKSIILVLLVILLPLQTLGQNINQDQSAGKIMQQITEEDSKNNQLKEKTLKYKRRIETYNSDQFGRISQKTSQELISIHPGKNGSSVEELLEKDSKKATGKPSGGIPIDLNALFKTRFDFDLNTNILMENNKSYLLINFKPKANPPTKSNKDDVINQIEGTIYIDLEGFYIAKIKAHLKQTVSWFLGAAKVHFLDLTMIQERRADLNNIVVIKSAEILYKYTVLGSGDYQKRIYSYEDYELTTNRPN